MSTLIHGLHPMTRLLRLMSLLLIAGVIAGCAANPTGGVDLVLMSEKKELELGARVSKQIEAQQGVYEDEAINKYVNDIGQKLVKVSHRPDIKYTFKVIDDDTVNAFALPGGYIYVTRGMLAHMNSEAELAAVLGHEIAHVTARHSVRQQSQAGVLGAAGTVASIATGTPGVGGLSGILGDVLIRGYGRDFELEADEFGAEYMIKGGYSTDGMLRTIEILRQKEKFEYAAARREDRRPNVYHGLFSTHPDHNTREREALKLAEKYGDTTAGKTGEEDFLRATDGLSYGKKNTVGVLRENIFFHPRLGIKLYLPKKWRLNNQRNRVMAISDDNNSVLQVTGANYGGIDSPQKYVMEAMNIGNIRDGKSVTVAGMPGYLAIADRARTPFGMRPVRVAVIFDKKRRMAYIMQGAGKRDLSRLKDDNKFIATIFSLDRMTQDDFKVAKPLKLTLLEAEPGVTMEKLASESPVSNYAVDHLRLINAMYPDGQPKSGQLIKVVQ